MERVKEIKLAKLSVDNKKELYEKRLDILRLLKEKVEAADVSQAIS